MNKFAISGKEFGETYHVGAAMFFRKGNNIRVFLVGDEVAKQEVFLTSIGGTHAVEHITISEYSRRKSSFDRASSATNIIRDEITKSGNADALRQFILETVINDEDRRVVDCYLKAKFEASHEKKILLWRRRKKCHQKHRNTNKTATVELSSFLRD